MAALWFAVMAVVASSCLASPQRNFEQQQDSRFDDQLSFSNHFTTTSTQGPIAKIVKQINKHNQDGSYTFGYESQDGSFRVETRGVDGITRGKYGYMDANGKLREIEYTAGTETGYEPSGAGIQVPPRPPKRQKGPFDYDYEDYDDQGKPVRRRPQQASRPAPAPAPAPSRVPQFSQQVPQHKPVHQPQPVQQHVQPVQHAPVRQSTPITSQQLLSQFQGAHADPFPAHTSRGSTRSRPQAQPQFEQQSFQPEQQSFQPQQQSFQPKQQSFQPQQQSFQPQQQSFQPQQQSFQPQQQSFQPKHHSLHNDPISAFLGRSQASQFN